MKPLTNVIILGSKPIKGMKSLGVISNLHISKNKSILENQVYNLKKKLNIEQIIYVGGHDFENLKNYSHKNVKLVYNDQFLTHNNGFNIKLAIDNMDDNHNLLILFNRILLSHKIFNRFDYSTSQVFISEKETKIGSIIKNNKIHNLFYNLRNGCCGIYYISKKDINVLKSVLEEENLNNLFAFEIINKMINLGVDMRPNFIKKSQFVYEINNNKNLQKLKRYYVKNFSI